MAPYIRYVLNIPYNTLWYRIDGYHIYSYRTEITEWYHYVQNYIESHFIVLYGVLPYDVASFIHVQPKHSRLSFTKLNGIISYRIFPFVPSGHSRTLRP